jgi:imidazolonepropionase-like amidohydrolase
MRRRAFVPLLLSAVTACAPGRLASPRGALTIAITNVTVIDATGAAPRPLQTVLIGDGRVLQISDSRRIRVGRGVRVLDGTGKFLIPGMWDMHVHAWNRQPFEALYLSHGIVGIREMGTGIDPQWGGEGIWRWREAVRGGSAPGPRIFAAGFILNGGTPDQQPIAFFKGVTTPEGARRWVDSLAARGADFIKVYSALAPEVYAAVADRAKEHGLPFAGHVPTRVGVRSVAAAGQRSIEHLYGFLIATSREEDAVVRELQAVLDTSGSPGAIAQIAETGMTQRLLDSYSRSKADSLFASLVANKTWVTPTLVTASDPRCAGSPLPLPDSAALSGVPRMLHGFVELREQSAASLATECIRMEALIQMTRSLHLAGVRLLAGSDAPNPGVVPGAGLHSELELLVRAGLTPLEALQAATRNAAEYLSLGRTNGTVEAGKAADLVLLDANPLADIRNTRRIDAVLRNGAVVWTRGEN